MPDLQFEVERAEPVAFAAAPLLAFHLRVRNVAKERVQSIALRCQIQIEPALRRYTPGEQSRLVDLFGEAQRWSETLQTMLWTHTGVNVPPFTGSTGVALHVPCSFDFNVAAVKYFHGLAAGEVPLRLQFSGTVFYESAYGALHVAPIPWDRETRFRLPVTVWKELIDLYYPNCAWLCLRRDVFERLYEFKVRHGIPAWDQTIEAILEQAGEAVKR